MAKPARRLDTALLVLAATLGTLPIALFVGALLARFLPVSADARFALGFGLTIPTWLAIMCVALLARSGARAFCICGAASMVLAVLVFGVGH
jgi:hypothetical protein